MATRRSPRSSSHLKFTGPFFQRDPAKTFRQNVRRMMDAVVDEGEGDVQQQMRTGEASRRPISNRVEPARVAAHVVGRTSSLRGKRWAVTGVVSVNARGLAKRQAKALMAAASRVEGKTHAFRRTTGRVRKARAVNTSELLRGIA